MNPCEFRSSFLPDNLNEAEWNGWRRELVIEELHPDGRPGKLPVQLLSVMNFLQVKTNFSQD